MAFGTNFVAGSDTKEKLNYNIWMTKCIVFFIHVESTGVSINIILEEALNEKAKVY
jgi:hypothetical protein